MSTSITRGRAGSARWMCRVWLVEAMALSVVLGPTLGLSGAASAQEAQEAERPVRTLVVAERQAIDTLLVDQKDAALRAALEMLPTRLRELPGEIPDFDAPPQIIDLFISLLSRPARIAVVDRGVDPETGAPGYGAVVSIGADPARPEASVREVQARIGELLAMNRAMQTKPSERFEGMTETFTPFGALHFGPRQSKGGEWRYELIYGAIDDPDAVYGALPAAAGESPFMRARINLAAFAPLTGMLAMFGAMAGPEGAAATQTLGRLGLIGPEALSFDVSAGQTQDRFVANVRAIGMARFAQGYGIPRAPLDMNALRVVPADATMAKIGKYDWMALWSQLEPYIASVPELHTFLGTLEEELGINLRDDVIASLGDVTGSYASDSTGGGGLFSMVMLSSIKNREALLRAHASIASNLHGFIDEVADVPGRVRVHEWDEDGVRYASLRFNGLPVPFEPSWAMTSEWLLFGLTPQALRAAVRQATGKGDEGLTANAAFRQHRFQPQGETVSVQFLDTTRVMRSGFGLTTMLGSLVSNAMRSPSAPARDPGMIVPLYHDLHRGSRPMIVMASWVGDDLMFEAQADRSALVNVSGAAGAFSASLAMFAPFILTTAIAANARARRQHHGWHEGELGRVAPDTQQPRADEDARTSSRTGAAAPEYDGHEWPPAHNIEGSSLSAVGADTR